MDTPYRIIPLTQGKVTFVDEQDYEELSQYRWYYFHHPAYAQRLGYAVRTPSRTEDRGQSLVYMHREILEVAKGVKVDHRDRDGPNNRRFNLRIATTRQNNANSGPKKTLIHSKFKGVKYIVQFQAWTARLGGKTLGTFNTEKEAALAFDFAALAEYGEFAYLNFPESADVPETARFVPRRSASRTPESGYQGVRRVPPARGGAKEYVARFYHHKIALFLGRFSTPEEAAIAYDRIAYLLMGDRAALNFPNSRTNYQNFSLQDITNRRVLSLVNNIIALDGLPPNP